MRLVRGEVACRNRVAATIPAIYGSTVTATLYTNINRIVWRQHAKGPGVATFDYTDGGHDHREMSKHQVATLAESLGLSALQDQPDFHEWVRL